MLFVVMSIPRHGKTDDFYSGLAFCNNLLICIYIPSKLAVGNKVLHWVCIPG